MKYWLVSTFFVLSIFILARDAWRHTGFGSLILDSVLVGLTILVLGLFLVEDAQEERDGRFRTFCQERNLRDRGCLESLRYLMARLFPNTTRIIRVYEASQTCQLDVYLGASNPEEIDPLFSVTVSNEKGFQFSHTNESGEDMESGMEFLIGLLEKRHRKV